MASSAQQIDVSIDGELSDEALSALAGILLDWADEHSTTHDAGQVDGCNSTAH